MRKNLFEMLSIDILYM